MKFEILDNLHPHWLAAAAGALVGLKAMPGTSMPEKLGNLGAGFALAAWAGPAIVDYLSVAKPSIAAGIVFGVGACGLVAFNALISAIRATDFGAWISGWLAAWSPRKKGGE